MASSCWWWKATACPTITLRISLPSGDFRDPAGLTGLSDATAAVIRLGTKTRTSKEIAETLAELGASVNFDSSQDSGSIFLSSLTENFDAALAILADILLNPVFPQDELDKWKTRIRSQIEQMKTKPGITRHRAPAQGSLTQMIFARIHGLRWMHWIRSPRDMVIEHYKTYYVPAGEWAGIAGDITPRDAVAKLDKALGAWKGGPVKHVTMPLPPPIADKRVILIPRPNSVQTFLVVANLAIDRLSPDYVECQVMNRVLGSGPSSRLFRNIREEKGYTYGIGSSFSATRTLNYFNALPRCELK